MLGQKTLVAARGREALGRLHESARTLGKPVEIHVPSLVGHPPPRVERSRTLLTSWEARMRMPGNAGNRLLYGVAQRRGKDMTGAGADPSPASFSRRVRAPDHAGDDPGANAGSGRTGLL